MHWGSGERMGFGTRQSWALHTASSWMGELEQVTNSLSFQSPLRMTTPMEAFIIRIK